MFALDPRIEADSHPLADLTLSALRLKRDVRAPWCLLIPRRAGITELHHLEPADRAALMEEIARVSTAIETAFAVDKINVAALGNVVAQLHVHVVGRRRDDFAWPGPTMGVAGAVDYDEEALASARSALSGALGL
ncbi:MAG: HIT domain-containing protein [Azospirillaceae bacterium]